VLSTCVFLTIRRVVSQRVEEGGVQAKPWVTRGRKADGTYRLGTLAAAEQRAQALSSVRA
jgi:hypothetical protein